MKFLLSIMLIYFALGSVSFSFNGGRTPMVYVRPMYFVMFVFLLAVLASL